MGYLAWYSFIIWLDFVVAIWHDICLLKEIIQHMVCLVNMINLKIISVFIYQVWINKTGINVIAI